MLISERLRPILILGVLFLMGFGLFSNVFGHGFIENWDDDWYVMRNELVRGVTADHLKRVFTEEYTWNYAPVHLLSYMIDYDIARLNPAMFHFTNWFIHVLNAWLVYLLIFEIHASFRAAAFAAVLFLVHPVQVESFAWISERKNVLACFFFLLSFLTYARYRKMESPAGYFSSLIFFVLAVLTKSIAVILPPFLLLYDIYAWRRDAFRKAVPFFVIALAAGSLSVFLQSGDEGLYFGGDRVGAAVTIPNIFVRYLRMFFYPSDLSPLYHVPMQKSFLDVRWLASTFIFTGFASLALRLCAKRKWSGFWMALFFAGLLPVLQIVPMSTPMNDRYLYFPMVAACGLSGMGMTAAWKFAGGSGRVLLVAASAGIFLMLSIESKRQTDIWQNGLVLWSNTVQRSPECGQAHQKHAESLLMAGRYAESADAFTRAESEGINNPSLYLYRGISRRSTGRLDEAMEDFDKLVRVPAYRDQAIFEKASTQLLIGDTEAANDAVNELSASSPKTTALRLYLADIFIRLNRPADARAELFALEEMGAHPYHTEYYLSRLFLRLGDNDRAEKHLRLTGNY